MCKANSWNMENPEDPDKSVSRKYRTNRPCLFMDFWTQLLTTDIFGPAGLQHW